MISDRRAAGRTGGAVPFYLLLLFVLLTPLPFGSVFQWSWAALGLIVGLLLIFASIALIFSRASLPPQLRAMWIPGGLYLLVVAWVALQGLDVPWGSHPLWRQTSEILGQASRETISLDPYKTWSECLKMLIFGGVFWLAARYGRDPQQARSALWIIVLAGTGYALYGLIAQLTEMGTYLWFHPMPTGDSGVRSTFVNRNLYAVYAGFGSLSAIALLLEKFSHGGFSLGDAHWTEVVRGKGSKVLFLTTCAFFWWRLSSCRPPAAALRRPSWPSPAS